MPLLLAQDLSCFGFAGMTSTILPASMCLSTSGSLMSWAGRITVSSTTRRPGRNGRKASASGLNTTEVREWAKAQGIEVKDRGRVPAELVVKFKAATAQ